MDAHMIKIQYVNFRNGRPRFEPGTGLRALKFEGTDLKRPDGSWMSAEEAASWVETTLKPAIEAARLRRDAGKKPAKPQSLSARGLITAELFERFLASPQISGHGLRQGEKAVSRHTLRDYKGSARVLEQAAPLIWQRPVAAITPGIAYGLFEDLWQKRGLHQARHAMRAFSAAISWGIQRSHLSLPANPMLNLNMKTPDPRLRAAEINEIEALVAAADRLNYPEIGDMIMLGVWTGQRQADRLAFAYRGMIDGWMQFKQKKTGAIVEIPASAELQTRINAIAARNQLLGISPITLISDAKGQPLDEWRYRKTFAFVREQAARHVVSVKDLRDQDLRDTSVTWLKRANCNEMEIASITGHSLQHIHNILKHYSAPHRDVARNAIDKLESWKGKKR
jgi:integrase